MLVFYFNLNLFVIGFKKSKLLIFNDKKYFFLLNLPKWNTISLYSPFKLILFSFKNNNFKKIIHKILINYIYCLYKFFFKKIKFSGKGYYIYKDKFNTIGTQFNYSHKLNFYFSSYFIKNFNKRSWMFWSLNSNILIKNLKYFSKIRSTNIFTNKGIKFTKTVLYIKK